MAIVSSGVVVGPDQKLTVVSDCIFYDTILSGYTSRRASMTILEGGVANGTEVKSAARMYVSNGGSAVNTVINGSSGFVDVSSGGYTNSTTVKNGGALYVSAGGSALNVNIDSTGYMYVNVDSSTYITGTSHGNVVKVGDRVTSNITIYGDYTMTVASNWTAYNTILTGYTSRRASMTILEGGVASGTEVKSAARMYVSNGGSAVNTVINGSSGFVYVSSGAYTNSTTVKNGGALYVSAGGSALNVNIDSTGYMYVNVDSRTYITGTSHGNAVQVGNKVTSNITIYGDYTMTVASNWTAYNTILSGYTSRRASMTVLEGGVASGTEVKSAARMYVSNGGSAANTMINGSSGYVDVSSGGYTNSTTVKNGGALYVSAGGSALNVNIDSTGYMYVNVDSRTYITGTSHGNVVKVGDRITSNITIYGDYTMTVASNWTAYNTILSGYTSRRASMTVLEGGVASGTEVKSAGRMFVSNGGSAVNTMINGSSAYVDVSSGGYTNSTTVKNGGALYVSAGGSALNINIESTGIMYANVTSQTYITGTSNGMSVKVGDKVTSNITIYGDNYMTVASNWTAYNTVLAGYTSRRASMTVLEGGVASSTEVKSAGRMYVSAGAKAVDTEVNGSAAYLQIASGAVASDTVVKNYGIMQVLSGGKITGTMQFLTDGSVTVSAGGIVDFDISNRTASDAALLNDWSYLGGAPTYTITVNANQANGTYKLAANASEFAATTNITIGNGSVNYGTLQVGGSVTYSGVTYTLSNADGNLNLTVAGNNPPPVLTPDLLVSEVSATGTFTNQDATVNFTVKNQGNGAAGASVAYIYDGNTLLGQVNVSALAAGGTFNGSYTIAAGTLTAGTHSIKVVTDATNLVAESNESNNSASQSLTVAAPPVILMPDLLVSGITLSSNSVTTQQAVTLNFTVKNQGSNSAGASIAYIYDGDTLLGQVNVGALNAGAVYNGSFNIAAGKLAAGTHSLKVVTDATDMVAESNESNNTATQSLTVTAPVVTGHDIMGYAPSGWESSLVIAQKQGNWVSNDDMGEYADTVITNEDNIFISWGSKDATSEATQYYEVDLYVDGKNVTGWYSPANSKPNSYIVDYNIGKLALGTHTITLKLDSSNAVAETNEDNNTITKTITVVQATHDIKPYTPSNWDDCVVINNNGGTQDSALTVNDDVYVNVACADISNAAYVKEFYFAVYLDGEFVKRWHVDSTMPADNYFFNTDGFNLGKLSAGSHTITLYTDSYGDVSESNEYNNNYSKTFTVSAQAPVPVTGNTFLAGNFNGGASDMLAYRNGSKLNIYQNGALWQSVQVDAEKVYAGDFNGDNIDDVLRQMDSGLIIGEYSNALGAFTPEVLNMLSPGWEIQGVGDFNGNGTDDVLIANPTAASSTVGLLGYWESGKSWTLINGYSPEWEMVGTGDFNNDGKTDMLWKNEFIGAGNLTYNAYCTWIVDNANDWRMVSVANPSDWNYLCNGDFNGDGCDDVALINNEGVVGIWGVNDGYMNSWSILSAVDTSAWDLAGVGDFNGDGTDDIAWCNTDSGITGYWQITNKQLNSWQNIATVA